MRSKVGTTTEMRGSGTREPYRRWEQAPPIDSRAVIVLNVHAPPEYAEAPEFEYLMSWVSSQAEAVAGPVVRVDRNRTGDARPGRELAERSRGPLLVLDCRTLLTGRSLQRMLRALEEGARAVTPVRLADTDLPAEQPIYTLRGFEVLEERVLRGGLPGVGTGRRQPSPPLPALLLAPDTIPLGVGAGELLGEPERTLPGVQPISAGLCHAFADYYGQGRDDVLPLLPEDCREVLEIGCGRGATGRLIQERLGCRVTGIDLNPVVARAAAEVLHRTVAGDVLRVTGGLAREGARFDAVVAFELFEHLTDQETFLAAARRLLRPGGRIVLSVPNVGHHAIVADLLAGRWDYLPIGLLCFTHFRFFTRRTLEDWLRRCGFDRFEILAQTTELPEAFEGGRTEAAFGGLELDRESLATKGFYVVVHV